MAKRKRTTNGEPKASISSVPSKKIKASTPPPPPRRSSNALTIQIVTGSYDRILHGITATISSTAEDVQFADTFLFTAHTSAIRALALSPPSAPVPKQTQKIILATGSTDERVNLYHLSAHAPSKITVPAIPSLTSKAVVENPSNKELGSLLHHGSSITKLSFPNRGKLLSSAEDSTIAVTRTRDWSLLSTIKAPIPKAVGRPSGDTAPLGGQPSGVNDFAVHPSMKLMISVGKGEKCMRLWNLVTGKKAGALTFERSMLGEVGEGKHSTGEGRKVAWGSDGGGGEEFCVVFERGVLVFGMDCKPKCKVVPEPRTKIHQAFYVSVGEDEDVLALSTEDGRILFYSTKPSHLKKGDEGLPVAKLVAQLGGKESGVTGRIKDFSVLPHEGDSIVSTASSDGAVRLWRLQSKDLSSPDNADGATKQAGKLLGTYETMNRITCLASFVMLPVMEGEDEEAAIPDEAGLEEGEDAISSSSGGSDSEEDSD